MIALVGLGLTGELTEEGKAVLERMDEVFVEAYTSFLPPGRLEKLCQKWNAEVLPREKVESDFLLKEAKKARVALMVIGDPLFATTHQVLVYEAKKLNLEAKVVHNTSVFSALGRTGVSLYNFGKIATISFWKENFKPTRPIHVLAQNVSINAHTLFLCDIDGGKGMDVQEGLEVLEKMAEAEDRRDLLRGRVFLACSQLCWEDEKVVRFTWEERENLPFSSLPAPACLVACAKLSPIEEELSSQFSVEF